MVNYKGDVATAVNTGGIINSVVQGFINARKKVFLESYTILGTEASGSTINIGGNLPKGAKVLSIKLAVTTNQTAATFSVGDSNSATRYASALTTLQTAGKIEVDGKHYVVGTATGDNAVLLTTGGATLTAGVLRAEIEVAFAD